MPIPGQKHSPERKARLRQMLLSRAPYADMLAEGFSSNTIAAMRRNLKKEEIVATPHEERLIGSEIGRHLPDEGETRYFLLTAAQDDTPIVDSFWRNLLAYRDFLGAELYVGGFTYQKGLFEDHSVTAGVFAQAVVPYLHPEIVDLAPRLVWYGRANILPTAADPLVGWDTQTRDSWAIFPHAKIALKSIPVMPGRPGKQIMTTGVVTQENYVQRNAGQKAEFHHTIGATIVEVRPDGRFWCRQIAAEKNGDFQDLDRLVVDGVVTEGNAVEAITWGDIHAEWMDPDVARGGWGLGGSLGCGTMVDALAPRYQFFHDLYDFTARSHHTRNDPHEKVRRIVEGMDVVEDAIKMGADFLRRTQRARTLSVAVFSNHDGLHIEKWLKDPLAASDAANAYYWHHLNAAYHRAIRDRDDEFMVHSFALREAGEGLPGIRFLREGESFLIAQGTAPIECGLHAHMGPRGGRGSAASLAKIVERVNAAHVHEPTIKEGAYFAGTSGILNPPYASRGPGAWHHSHIVTYPSGKRTIVTMQNGRWRA